MSNLARFKIDQHEAFQDIIIEYQKKYPHIIKPILQSENQYSKGIKRIEYEFNGESFEKEFDNPEDVKEYELELKCIEGKNTIKVKAYATQEEVYTEDSGECEYVKQ